MEPFLESGNMAGKIICPNKKCGVKLGNYDWAGVCCSCKEWVTPVGYLLFTFTIYLDLVEGDDDTDGFMGLQGFCIHRSKVDEVV